MNNKKVFLGGTCNNSSWRNELIDQLSIDYFNPVVENWTPECMEEERRQREDCDYCLYVITPEMIGVYSIAEAVDDSNKRPNKTIFCVLKSYGGSSFGSAQLKSLNEVGKLIERNGGYYFTELVQVAMALNHDFLVGDGE